MSHTPVPVPCRAFLNDFSAFVDGELPPLRRDEIQAHVDCCQACLDHLTAYRRGITVLRSIEAEVPGDFWTRLEERLWLGPELSVLEGGLAASRRPARWSRPAVSLAVAAVLALFVIARGLGPGDARVRVGPQGIQASVAMTLPTVPEAEAAPQPSRAVELPASAGRAVRRAPAEPVRLASWDVPGSGDRAVRFREDRWGGRVALVRTAASVTPAPWTVDRAVGLP